MATLRRSFRDDYIERLDRLVQEGVIIGYDTDVDGYGSVHGLHLTVTGPELTSTVAVAMLRDKVRTALAHLTDNVIIVVDRRGWLASRE